jgi:protein tyrosine/serine phosphatase
MSAPPPPLPLNVLVPPINFAMIQSGLYRSGFPVETNFPFISRLRLHTILNLSSEEYSRDTTEFLDRNNISCVAFAIFKNDFV